MSGRQHDAKKCRQGHGEPGVRQQEQRKTGNRCKKNGFDSRNAENSGLIRFDLARTQFARMTVPPERVGFSACPDSLSRIDSGSQHLSCIDARRAEVKNHESQKRWTEHRLQVVEHLLWELEWSRSTRKDQDCERLY
jgi:hypothetical protein